MTFGKRWQPSPQPIRTENCEPPHKGVAAPRSSHKLQRISGVCFGRGYRLPE
jgi:hypothetical protein